MKKSELKNSMLVETKTKRYLVLATQEGVKLLSKDGYMNLSGYNDDLTHKDVQWTINKVYQPSGYGMGMKIIDTDYDFFPWLKLLWKRKEIYKFNDRQLEVLAPYRHDYADWWFAKDKNCDLYIYSKKPEKQVVIWLDASGDLENIMFEHLFDDYDWETEPIQLKEIFKGTKYE